MDTKLTLKLDQQIIERAKEYAAGKKLSLSRIIESYLTSLVSKNDNDDIQISPFVKSISTGKSISPTADIKKEYADHLLKKHQ